MPYAVQVLEVARPACRRRWRTVTTAKRLATAERVADRVRQDREQVMTLTRVRPFNGPIARAFQLAAEV